LLEIYKSKTYMSILSYDICHNLDHTWNYMVNWWNFYRNLS